MKCSTMKKKKLKRRKKFYETKNRKETEEGQNIQIFEKLVF